MLLRKEAMVCLVLSLGTNSAFESKILIFCRGGTSALLFNTYNIYSIMLGYTDLVVVKLTHKHWILHFPQ